MLHEAEILDVLMQNLRSAKSDCEIIARQPRSGLAFIRLRRSLKLAEGACRQAAQWREDARWLKPGLYLEQAHQIARGWLHRPTVQSKKLFTGLAAALGQMLFDLKRLEKMRSGQVGSILLPNSVPNPMARLVHAPALPMGLLAPRS